MITKTEKKIVSEVVSGLNSKSDCVKFIKLNLDL